jgi:hypothetical protein
MNDPAIKPARYKSVHSSAVFHKCEDCGSYVGLSPIDHKRHDDLHRRIDNIESSLQKVGEIASRADSTASLFRPIG